MAEQNRSGATNFIRQIIDDDIASGRTGEVVTRFPPEPNGYLHIGHAKSICLNFGIAQDYGGRCNLRFDDTNPGKEDLAFVRAIEEDVRWLGFGWSGEPRYASDYFESLYNHALALVEQGLAYVCSLDGETMRSYRGTLTEPGRESPDRDRPIAENLELFRRMRAGEFADGRYTLRARIDMAHPNLNLRDPVLYRIRHGVIHHQTGSEWCLYPMYDFTHPLSDALEGVTHSICTLEFEDHRPLYDWVIEHCVTGSRPRQYEFSRLNLQYSVMSKRRLTELVSGGHVQGWDDPRMPTLAGMRRRGYPPAAIRDFCGRIGVTKSESTSEIGLLESCVRDVLDRDAPRRMAVLRPLLVELVNVDQSESLVAANHPKRPEMGQRTLDFGPLLWIDRDDYRSEAPKGFKRLVDGGLVRLRNGWIIRHLETLHAPDGSPERLRCERIEGSLEGNPEGIKPRGVIHWVDHATAIDAELRLYDRLFRVAEPAAGGASYLDHINPESLITLNGCKLEAALSDAVAGQPFQFEREGYFVRDHSPLVATEQGGEAGKLAFNLTVTLRDSWSNGR